MNKLDGKYTVMTNTPCIDCVHIITYGKCKAFPDKIPEEIWEGTVKHTSHYPGDNGIIFEENGQTFENDINANFDKPYKN